MTLKTTKTTDGISVVTTTHIPKPHTYTSVAQVREVEAAFKAAYGAWGFEHSIGGAERFWLAVPADTEAEPLSLGSYRERILRQIAYVRQIVALRDSADPLNKAKLEQWILEAMRLGKIITEAEWRFTLGDDIRGNRRKRRQAREQSPRAAQIHRRKTHTRYADLARRVRDYQRQHPDWSLSTLVENLNRRLQADDERPTSLRTISRVMVAEKTRQNRR